MKSHNCPTCTTWIVQCDRCGTDHPMHSFPPGHNGTLNSSKDIRFCDKCMWIIRGAIADIVRELGQWEEGPLDEESMNYIRLARAADKI